MWGLIGGGVEKTKSAEPPEFSKGIQASAD
jgi:hypothetical protein